MDISYLLNDKVSLPLEHQMATNSETLVPNQLQEDQHMPAPRPFPTGAYTEQMYALWAYIRPGLKLLKALQSAKRLRSTCTESVSYEKEVELAAVIQQESEAHDCALWAYIHQFTLADGFALGGPLQPCRTTCSSFEAPGSGYAGIQSQDYHFKSDISAGRQHNIKEHATTDSVTFKTPPQSFQTPRPLFVAAASVDAAEHPHLFDHNVSTTWPPTWSSQSAPAILATCGPAGMEEGSQGFPAYHHREYTDANTQTHQGRDGPGVEMLHSRSKSRDDGREAVVDPNAASMTMVSASEIQALLGTLRRIVSKLELDPFRDIFEKSREQGYQNQ